MILPYFLSAFEAYFNIYEYFLYKNCGLNTVFLLSFDILGTKQGGRDVSNTESIVDD